MGTISTDDLQIIIDWLQDDPDQQLLDQIKAILKLTEEFYFDKIDSVIPVEKHTQLYSVELDKPVSFIIGGKQPVLMSVYS